MKKDSINLKTGVKLQDDNVFVKSEIVPLQSLCNLPSRKGLENLVVSEGQIVNVVSDSYGHLPNERFYYAVEEKLIDTGIDYITRSINRENRSFAVDYILNDERYEVCVKSGKDKIRPMLRFVNSYDGSCKTSGHFGFFREVCSNGLHVAHSVIGFSVKHRGDIAEIVLPEIRILTEKFISNEFYELRRKFEVMAERPILDLRNFVKVTAESLKLFQFEASEKNPEPSLNARLVMDAINSESNLLSTSPNLWIGYNAFNGLLHGKLKKNFEQQKQLDGKLFETVLQLS